MRLLCFFSFWTIRLLSLPYLLLLLLLLRLSSLPLVLPSLPPCLFASRLLLLFLIPPLPVFLSLPPFFPLTSASPLGFLARVPDPSPFIIFLSSPVPCLLLTSAVFLLHSSLLRLPFL